MFTKTSKTVPADETSKNAQLLLQAGFIHKEMAGVYDYLPIGLRVVEKIKSIVREEMNAIGGQELIMSSLQRKEVWEQTNRWDDELVDVWFKTELKNGAQVGLGWSHEEPMVDMARNHISSYRDLPLYGYQFQTKLRNELRAKSGIMRGREFVMKDMYSFTVDEAAHKQFYDGTIKAYEKVFERIGLGDDTFLTFASGGAFTQFSHEFQTISEAGEDIIYVHRGKKLAVNKEVFTDDVLKQLGIKKEELEEVKAAEVGNIFSFGSTKSTQLGLYFTDEKGEEQPVILGSYGIGVTRLMGVIVEHFADERGIVWPEAVSPYLYHIVTIAENETDGAYIESQKLYDELVAAGKEVLWDDRVGVRAGSKFADADLIGLPHRLVISDRSLKAGGIEYKKRSSSDSEIISIQDFLDSAISR